MNNFKIVMITLLCVFSLRSEPDTLTSSSNPQKHDSRTIAPPSDTFASSIDTLTPNSGTKASSIDTLDNTFNLGRIPSQVLSDYLTDWDDLGDHNLFLTTFHNQFGKTGKFCFGMTPLVFGLSDDFTMASLTPELDFSAVPSASNRLKITIMPLNLVAVWTSYGSATGFDVPFTVMNMYQWSFLSRQGAITVSPDQYNLTFLIGPQLNPGQFRSDVSVVHTINADTVPLRVFDVSVYPKIGIAKGLEIGADAHYSYHDSVTETIYTSSSYNGNYKNYGKYTKDSTYIACKLDFRLDGFFTEAEAGANWWNIKWSKTGFFDSGNTTDYKYNTVKLRLSAGLLLGDRIDRFENVLGNWDGFFSNVIGNHQILTTVSLEAIPDKKVKTSLQSQSFMAAHRDSSFSCITIGQKSRYGIIDHFEIGEEFSMTLQSYSLPVYGLGLQMSMNSVPLRNYGPAAASNQEYFQGLRLKQGQCHGFLRYSPPFFKQELPYDFIPILERIGTLGGITALSSFGGNTSYDGITRLVESSKGTLLFNPDIAVRFSWGVTNWLTFSNDIEFENINYKPSPQQTVAGQTGFAVTVIQPGSTPLVTPSNNSVFNNVTMFTFHFGDARRLSIAGFYAQQKENDPASSNGMTIYRSKDELQDFMLFALYQVAIPYGTFSKAMSKVQSPVENK